MNDEIEDVKDAIRSGRVVRDHGPYLIQVGNDQLEYRPVTLEDPVPTGRQILEAAGYRPIEEHVVFQVLSSGLLEELRPDETTDLRTRGVEAFLIFRSDRSFRFELDGRIFEWGGTRISGLTLKKLAAVDLATYGVWLEVHRGEDQRIGDQELFDLSRPGVERFFTGIVETTEG